MRRSFDQFRHSIGLRLLLRPALLLVLASALGTGARAELAGTAFSYQGCLTDKGLPANGLYDLQFTLWDAVTAGNQVGDTVALTALGITNGLFAVELDFGSAPFGGEERWLQVGVRQSGSAADFTVLSPRQRLSPHPYALFAFSAREAVKAQTMINGQASNLVVVGATVSGLTNLDLVEGRVVIGGPGGKMQSADVGQDELRSLAGIRGTVQVQLDVIASEQAHQAQVVADTLATNLASVLPILIEGSNDGTNWVGVTALRPTDSPAVFIQQQTNSGGYQSYRARFTASATVTRVVLNSMEDLKVLAGGPGTMDVTIRGYYAPGDGGGGDFYWDAASTEPDDGGVAFATVAAPELGRWKRMFSGPVNVLWFGAVRDGSRNARSAIQAALDFVDSRGGGAVYLPAGRYLLEERARAALEVGDNVVFEGDGPSSLLVSHATQALRNRNSETATGNVNITVRNMAIECEYNGIMGIYFGGASDCTIANVCISNPLGYGIWLLRSGDSAAGEGLPTKRVVVQQCHVTGVVDVGIECSGAVGCSVVGNTVTGRRGIAGYYAWNGATDCVFSGNVAEGVGATNDFRGYQVHPLDSLNPAANRTQTQRISFVGNIARNVAIGFRITGVDDPSLKPHDILVEGNSFFGTDQADAGVLIAECSGVSVLNNQIVGFSEGLVLNPLAAGVSFGGATRIFIEGNAIRGGGESYLYGNRGGSLLNNKFYGQTSHSVILVGWQGCNVSNNTFSDIGVNAVAWGIVVRNYSGQNTIGNTFDGNRTMDSRATKWTFGPVLFVDGGMTSNIISGNSAVGSRSGGLGFQDAGMNTGNVVGPNLDAP